MLGLPFWAKAHKLKGVCCATEQQQQHKKHRKRLVGAKDKDKSLFSHDGVSRRRRV